jgi:tRNA-uridine 2-sulfurtransferase
VSQRVIVALSGGVDSAVTALLLKRQGHDVQGLFMHNWEADDEGYCTAAEDFQDARRVAAQLSIPLHSVDFSLEYRQRVFQHFLAEYRAGRTPNPDVLCNREIKFGDCLRHARRLGGDLLATGHYARVIAGADGPELHKGMDHEKDQSYFLHAVHREHFSRVLMPLGDLHKPQVRELARAAGLPVFDKPDSTGICFIGERPFRAFLEQYIERTPGAIETADGRQVGEHIGLAFYTLGQRGGIGIGGTRDSNGAAWYVTGKDAARNVLNVAQGPDQKALMTRQLQAAGMNWLSDGAPAQHFSANVKLRYRQADQPATIDAIRVDCVGILTDEPQRAVAPGQSAVIYQGDRCLGGGVIARTDI